MLRRLFSKPSAPAAAPAVDPNLTTLSIRKFVDAAPTPQAAIDVFAGRWASSFPDLDPPVQAGDVPHFTIDHRPRQAAAMLGDAQGRLDGYRILELGPLEGGHTYQLERLGAEVTAIEGNAEAYLKCLVAKELTGMRSRFLLGNFTKHLQGQGADAWDMIFASGVLYHMVRPLELIALICRAAPRAYLWTHYYDPERSEGFAGAMDDHNGFTAEHFQKHYGDRSHGRFWGGLAEAQRYLKADDIVAAFRAFGHDRVEVLETNLEHPHGPCFTLATSRST